MMTTDGFLLSLCELAKGNQGKNTVTGSVLEGTNTEINTAEMFKVETDRFITAINAALTLRRMLATEKQANANDTHPNTRGLWQGVVDHANWLRKQLDALVADITTR